MQICEQLNVPRNQTPEHCELANRAIRWMGARSTGRGIYGGTEVRLAEGFVVDAAAIGGFQRRFLAEYLEVSGLKEKTYACGEIRGDVCNEFACVFEAKATRSDFLNTFGAKSGHHANRHEPIGSLHWCVTPPGIVKDDELPEFWGHLQATGSGLKQVKLPRIVLVEQETINRFAYGILTSGAYNQWKLLSVCPNCFDEPSI
jgi:hypothetical protein